MQESESMKITVVIPALNEEKTIAKVVRDFKQQLPEAEIIVYDNNSTDRTVEEAKKAGAKVLVQHRRGKGNVIRAMFENVESDIYIMVDGDDTYVVDNVRELIAPVAKGEADMVVGARLNYEETSFSWSHKLGNKLITTVLNRLFGTKLKDVESGYRVMNRELVKSVILLEGGFGIEPELTIRCLQQGFRIQELPVHYRSRPEGSHSKLNTINDGYVVLYTMITLFRDYNPIKFFSLISLFFLIIGLITGSKITIEYLMTGSIGGHTGTAAFTIMMIILSTLVFLMGVLLDSVNNKWRVTQEMIRKAMPNSK
ncbi:glycosyl transferase [candidate division KSB1 bacterium]|nr:MAG: glycosyl transferase [candidate division KSB1 bacterium]